MWLDEDAIAADGGGGRKANVHDFELMRSFNHPVRCPRCCCGSEMCCAHLPDALMIEILQNSSKIAF